MKQLVVGISAGKSKRVAISRRDQRLLRIDRNETQGVELQRGIRINDDASNPVGMQIFYERQEDFY